MRKKEKDMKEYILKLVEFLSLNRFEHRDDVNNFSEKLDCQ